MNVVSADSAYLLEMRSQDLNIKEHFWDAQSILLQCTKLRNFVVISLPPASNWSNKAAHTWIQIT